MKRLAIFGVLAAAVHFSAFGADFSGRLVDAGCIDKGSGSHPPAQVDGSPRQRDRTAAACAPTGDTTVFAVQTSGGKLYRFDEESNQKAVTLIQTGNLKPDGNGEVQVLVTGEFTRDLLRVGKLAAVAKPK